MTEHLWGWILFNLFVLLMLGLDLGLFHRTAHVVRVREALAWSAVWIALATIFGVGLYFTHDSKSCLDFFAGYLIEKSLSIDNLFVFLLIFHYFQVPGTYQHKILFWGILGALVMRAIFIAAGIALLHQFSWTIYIFGGFLIYTGIKLFFEKDKKIEPEKNRVLRLFRRMMPTKSEYHEDHFFVRENGRLFATPLFVVLIVVETTDVIFAVDSIPAILAITDDAFIVYTSNVFAILGLRSLYFALAGLMQLFHYLHYGLAIILIFVGGKMLLAHSEYKVPTVVTLIVVAGVLGLSVLISVLFPAKMDKETEELVRSTLPPGEEPLLDGASPDATQPPSEVGERGA
jgi:tellurite resistance protein TerC